jgi:hypothetical protein
MTLNKRTSQKKLKDAVEAPLPTSKGIDKRRLKKEMRGRLPLTAELIDSASETDDERNISTSEESSDSESDAQFTKKRKQPKKKMVSASSSFDTEDEESDNDVKLPVPSLANAKRVANKGQEIELNKRLNKLLEAERAKHEERINELLKTISKRDKALKQVNVAKKKLEADIRQLTNKLRKNQSSDDSETEEESGNESDSDQISATILESTREIKYIREDYGYTYQKKVKVGNSSPDMYFHHVELDGEEYTVLCIPYKGVDRYAIIDRYRFEDIVPHAWHFMNNCKYLASSYKGRDMYMHNFLMGKETFNGKGQLESVDHVNQIGVDNRMCNLRFASQTEQNLNQKRRDRKLTLPINCGFTVDDVPKSVWLAEEKDRAPRWCIELKGIKGLGEVDGIKVKKGLLEHKGTCSSELDLIVKLQCIKLKLKDWYERYPQLRTVIGSANATGEINRSREEYCSILKASCFKKSNVNATLPKLLENKDGELLLSKKQKIQLQRALLMKPGAKRLPKLPNEEILKAYGGYIIDGTDFKPAGNGRGSKFVILESHPVLKANGWRQMETTGKKNVSDSDKLKELNKMLKKLQKQMPAVEI